MRVNRLVAVLAVFAAACASASSSNVATTADSSALTAAQSQIAPMFAEMLAAANAHDTDRHLAAYQHSSSLVFVVNDEMIPGWDSLRVRQLQWWQNGKSDAVYQVVGAPTYEMPGPGVVVQTYFLSSRRSSAGTSGREARLGVTDVWKQLPEGWRIVYAHESLVFR